MKTVQFTVTIELSGDGIMGTDYELQQMAEKIAIALKKQSLSPTVDADLTPDGCDESAKHLTISHSGIILVEQPIYE